MVNNDSQLCQYLFAQKMIITKKIDNDTDTLPVEDDDWVLDLFVGRDLRGYIAFSLGKYRVVIYFFNHVTIVLFKCDKKFQKVHLLLCFCVKFRVQIRKIREGTLLAAELLLFVMAYCEHEITVTAQLGKKLR